MSYRRCICLLERAEGCICSKGPLESSCMTMPRELDARALKKRLEDRDVIIGVLRDRCQKLEGAIEEFWGNLPTEPLAISQQEIYDGVEKLRAALEVLPPVKP